MLNQMERNALLALSRGKITIPSATRLRDAAAFPVPETIAS